MLKKWQLFTLLAVLIIFLTACSPAPQTATPTDPPIIEEEAQPEVEDENEVIVEEEEEEQAPAIDAAAIFTARCARCHAADRSGNNGPALLPERLTKDPSVYEATIINGSGPMPSFSNRLSADEISAMVEFILSDPE